MHGFTGTVSIPAGDVATIEFFSAGGAPVEARALDIRFSGDAGHAGKIHHTDVPHHSLAEPVDPLDMLDWFFDYDGESFRTHEGEVVGKMLVYNSDAAAAVAVYVRARGEVDISGSTLTT